MKKQYPAKTPTAKTVANPSFSTTFTDIEHNTKNIRILLAIIFIGALIGHLPGLTNEFTWDARKYIMETPYIEKFTWDNWVKLWTSFELGNYHPLTVLSWMIEYQFVGENTWLYHLDNIFLHTANSFMIFLILYRYTKRFVLAASTAVLFAVHPLHVESVVWAAERKDTLYCLFFLLAWIFYNKYLDSNRNIKFLLFSLLLFIASCLSKGMAVVLPVVLLLTDYFFLNRKIELRLVIEKIPYFLISLGTGLLAIYVQRDAGADATKAIASQYSILERLQMISWGVSYYWLKMLFPFNLTAFYSYPDKPFPTSFQLAPLFLLSIMGVLYLYARKNKWIAWGALFFFIVIFPVSQIMPIGSAIAADRYFYVSSIGSLFLLGMVIDHAYRNRAGFRKALPVIGGAVVVILTLMSFNRSKVWKSDITLFQDVLKYYPKNGFITGNVGWAYLTAKDTAQAIYHYEKANELGWHTDEIYVKMADIYFAQKNYPKAVINYEAAIKLKPEKKELKNLYWAIATCYYYTEDQNTAVKYVNMALALDKKNFFAHNVMGLIQTKAKNYGAAIVSFRESIKYNKKFYDPYINLGHALDEQGLYNQSIPYYEQAIKIDSAQQTAWKNIGVAYDKMGQWRNTVELWKRATKVFPNDPAYEYNIALKLGQNGQQAEAVRYLQSAAKRGDINAQNMAKGMKIPY